MIKYTPLLWFDYTMSVPYPVDVQFLYPKKVCHNHGGVKILNRTDGNVTFFLICRMCE